MKSIPAIKQFFADGKHGREVTLAELKVECAKLVRGTIVHGNLIETGDKNAGRRAELEAEKQRIEAELVALGSEATND